MDRATLLNEMTALLRTAVEAQGESSEIEVRSDSVLVGADSVLSSLALVTYILDLEGMLGADHGIEVTLVNESAFSRSESPFRTLETLADYVLELAGLDDAGGEEPVQRVAQA